MTPIELAEEMHQEVLDLVRANGVAMEIEHAEPLLPTPDTAADDWFTSGIEAGYLCTMQMLIRRRLLGGVA